MATPGKSRVRFGPGGLIYLVVSALILVLAVLSQANVLFWSFGLLVGGLIVSIAISLNVLRRTQVQRLLPTHGVAGEALVLRYRITNDKSWMPVFNLVIRETWGKGPDRCKKVGPVCEQPQRLGGPPHSWVMHLGPKQSVQADAPCWPRRRGMLQFDCIELGTTFPFGIFRCLLSVEQPGEVLVFPHLYRINRNLLHRMPELEVGGTNRRERAGDTEEFLGLRSYRVGDNLKMVDWKHSAHTGEMICREMSRLTPPKIMLALDLTAHTVEEDESGQAPNRQVLAERALSLAASIICDAHMQGYQIGVVVSGAEPLSYPIYHSLPHRTRMLEALARLDTNRHVDASEPLTVEPSVIIHLGSGDKCFHNGRCQVLGARNMDRYVSEAKDGSESLLERRPVPPANSRQMQEAGT